MEKGKFKRVHSIVPNCATRLEVRIDNSVAKGRKRAKVFLNFSDLFEDVIKDKSLITRDIMDHAD